MLVIELLAAAGAVVPPMLNIWIALLAKVQPQAVLAALMLGVAELLQVQMRNNLADFLLRKNQSGQTAQLLLVSTAPGAVAQSRQAVPLVALDAMPEHLPHRLRSDLH